MAKTNEGIRKKKSDKSKRTRQVNGPYSTRSARIKMGIVNSISEKFESSLEVLPRKRKS